MPTNAEIKALINTRVRAQRSHILNDGIAEILDFIVDNIAAGPGGAPGIDDILAEGQSLTAERTIDLNGKSIQLLNDGFDVFRIDISGASQSGYLRSKSGTNRGEVNPQSSDTQTITTMWASFNNDAKKANIELLADATHSIANYEADGHKFTGIQEFANNAAAIIGELGTGMLYYRTGHGLDIVTE